MTHPQDDILYVDLAKGKAVKHHEAAYRNSAPGTLVPEGKPARKAASETC